MGAYRVKPGDIVHNSRKNSLTIYFLCQLFKNYKIYILWYHIHSYILLILDISHCMFNDNDFFKTLNLRKLSY